MKKREWNNLIEELLEVRQKADKNSILFDKKTVFNANPGFNWVQLPNSEYIRFEDVESHDEDDIRSRFTWKSGEDKKVI